MSPQGERGLILIPDISGYTAFVHEAHAEHAQRVISSLLEALIDAERLDLQLCEIEGDALFFFRPGRLPDFERIVDQVAGWHEAFHDMRRSLRRHTDCGCGACARLDSLTLKVVAHYGQIRVQKIKHLQMLFGGDVILAHRLLKNSLPLHSYFLFTDALADRCELGVAARFACVRHDEDYPVFGKTALNVIPLPIAAGSTTAEPNFTPLRRANP
ncbi:MAG: DUF2652 domain-containing protein [Candidatus Lambdaproteobacteria bacterium]|nr:DUF2652 domain-containing protein [Candidatus Lambdaproteobacteria bacterium]